MPGRLKVALIGCGSWGGNHARVYFELNDVCELVAVCDVDRERAEKVARRYGCKAYTDYRELIRDWKPEAVSICTPSSTHFEIAYEVVRDGIDVLVEKPMCTSVNDALKLVSEAERRGVVLMPGHIECFNPGVRRVRSMIEEGRLGDILMLTAKRVSYWPERIGDVGIVMDTVIHDVYVFRYLLSEDPSEVYALAGRLMHRFEDYVGVILRYGGSTIGFIEANWMTPRKVRNLTVTGSNAIVSLDYLTQEIVYENKDSILTPISRWDEPLKIEIRHFIEASLGKCRLEVTGYDGLEALKVCEAILESSRTHKPVKLER
ncbi:MAG: Gfo/Idh/MocA family oxidoreductase [Nitrososphaerota archaeon]|nr:Gfo/Idh/MocA family oxidoreductase [Candidatus Bathyarchaeota archaeon]MDW8061499.1 Gfo/Idh/MocA family oxidoreductase [Nitrososphaerota archaeon]